MILDKSLQNYATNIAKLTFDMEKICRTKEVLFCDSIDLTPVEFRCLRYLLKANFSQVKDLANDMNLTPPRITSLLNSLEEKKYVSRVIASDDRRIIKVTLTSLGEEFATEIQKKYVKFHEDILSSIENENELEEILASLKSFQNILETFLKNKGGNK
jgi:DNA-binding MarR family transcriptional regulator